MSKYIQDICVDLGADVMTSAFYYTPTGTISYDAPTQTFTLDLVDATSANVHPQVGVRSTIATESDGKLYRQIVTCTSTRNIMFIRNIRGGNIDGSTKEQYINVPVNQGETKVLVNISYYNDGGFIGINGRDYPDFAGTITIEYKEVTAAEIQNYTDACRTTYLNTNKGMSNLLLEQDASGRPTGITPITTGNGKHIIFPMLPTPYDYTDEMCFKEAYGDTSKLNITHCDDTTEVI